MMRRFYVMALFALACGASLSAQTGTDSVFQHPLMAAQRPRFNELCAALSKHPVVKGTFEQTRTISRLNRALVSQGTFIIAAEVGMVWETLTPFPSTLAAGRDYLVQSTPSGSKTRLDAQGNEAFLRFSETISAVFSGNAQRLADNFTLWFTESGGEWTVGLVPKDKTMQSFATRIVISGGALTSGSAEQALRSVRLDEQNGDTIRYALSNHVFSEGLNAREKNLFVAK
ncbi:MAG: outer membrane lipoprotein carrier protein LolA [Treponema sp.]|jgi:hypothetical protein|nr:outer membrane lipoprotein carrier protein LolA [Treponema sp.]